MGSNPEKNPSKIKITKFRERLLEIKFNLTIALKMISNNWAHFLKS
jgi:hypothetical protein